MSTETSRLRSAEAGPRRRYEHPTISAHTLGSVVQSGSGTLVEAGNSMAMTGFGGATTDDA
jgi:hypothetical protein